MILNINNIFKVILIKTKNYYNNQNYNLFKILNKKNKLMVIY